MQGTINVKFEIEYKTNKGNVRMIIKEQELEVELYLDRVEECFGYHEIWECNECSLENAIDEFKDSLEIEEVEEWASLLDDNEYIVDIINVEVI